MASSSPAVHDHCRRCRCGRDHRQRPRRPDRSGREWGPPPVASGQADQGRDHRRRLPEQGDRRQVRHEERQEADEGRRRHPARLPRPHRLGHGGHPQRDHLGTAAQAHGLDRRGLPRRRRDPRRPRAHQPRPALHHEQLRRTADVRAAAGGGLPQARRLPGGGGPHGQDVHHQPEGVRRVGVRWRRRGLEHHLQQCHLHERHGQLAQAVRHDHGASAVVHPRRRVQQVLGAQRLPGLRLRHHEAAGGALPAGQRPLCHRP